MRGEFNICIIYFFILPCLLTRFEQLDATVRIANFVIAMKHSLFFNIVYSARDTYLNGTFSNTRSSDYQRKLLHNMLWFVIKSKQIFQFVVSLLISLPGLQILS